MTPIERMATDLGLDMSEGRSPNRYMLSSNSRIILIVNTDDDGQITSVTTSALISRVLPSEAWNVSDESSDV